MLTTAAAMPAAAQQRSATAKPDGAPPERKMLQSRYGEPQVTAALLPRDKWHPFATAADRKTWDALDTAVRKQFAARGEKALDGDWPALPASVFLEFVRNGNRSNYERLVGIRRNRLRDLVLAECVEHKGRFTDQIVNGVWATCEESWWGYPAHTSLHRTGTGLPDVADPAIDLFAAEAAVLLAWTDYLLAPQFDQVHKKVRQRIALEMERRILKPYRERDDFWWMGFERTRAVNNWNPWVNSNCLAVALLYDTDAARRAAMVAKIIRSLDAFLDVYHEDGGCDEGPSYWGRAGASLFENLELLHSASAGRINAFDIPLVKEIGRYIYRVQIAGSWYVDFADASARVTPDADIVYRYGKRIGDADMQALGASIVHGRPFEVSTLPRTLSALASWDEMSKAPARQPLPRDAWLPGIQVMTARMAAGTPKGLYIAAKGGHNAESHNHNDVGSFIIYSDGEPAIIDAGVETYTAKTFSPQRYEIWTMQSAYHNLPTVNGVMQAPGREFAARDVIYKATDAATEFALDIAGAYPGSAGIKTWRRDMKLDRAANTVEIRDRFELAKPNVSVDFTLMTPGNARAVSAGVVDLSGGMVKGTVRIAVSGLPFEVAVEEVPITDGRMKPIWGASIRRVLLKARSVPAKGEFRIVVSQA